jgi:hypothetical protein
MQNSNGDTGPTPPEPGDTPQWVPTAEQPWRPIPDDGDSGIRYLFDYGAPWCADRAGHPQFQDDGYPSLNHHQTECRSYDGWFGALNDEGRPGYLSAYLMRPFRFGQQRTSTADETRLAVEFEPAEDDGGPLVRCTVPASIIRNLAAHLAQTAGVADGWRPPHHVRQGVAD